ncbi:PcfJ domain-containing protein [Enterococcus hirae]|uniref:PcfJ domain-containing protein n=1 Tax=Enterococcus hirae TaxID=1354 RepID=UPI0030CA14B2
MIDTVRDFILYLKLCNRTIKTNKELFLEGSTMHHCVYNYLEKIQRGGSTIWKYERQKHRYTVEIEKRKYGNYEVL